MVRVQASNPNGGDKSVGGGMHPLSECADDPAGARGDFLARGEHVVGRAHVEGSLPRKLGRFGHGNAA